LEMPARPTWRSVLVPPPGVLAVPVPAPATVAPVATVVAVAEPLSAVTPDWVTAAAEPLLTSGLNGSLPEAAASPEAVTEVEGPISWARVVVGTAPAVAAGGAVCPWSPPLSSGQHQQGADGGQDQLPTAGHGVTVPGGWKRPE